MRRRQMVQAGLTHEPPRKHLAAEIDWCAEYHRIFGAPPHHRMKPETIRARVEASRGDIR